MTVQGIGIQQHSYPSHSIHFVFPAAPPSPLTILLIVEDAAEPGPLRFTSVEEVEVHILDRSWVEVLSWLVVFRR